ncbi:hypothetical protein [Streptomyces sp. NPDC001492]
MRDEVGEVAELRALERQFDIAIGVQMLHYAGASPPWSGCAVTYTGA